MINFDFANEYMKDHLLLVYYKLTKVIRSQIA